MYVWYSAATDVTGKKIQEFLKANGGTATPPKDADVLCWGTKTDKNVDLPNKVVYNHPNKIKSNRDKVSALKLFKKDGVNVADFTDNMALAGTKDFPFPLVFRTKFHQGGAGFWLCLNKLQAANAIKEGAQYMQNYVNIQDEYRLHIVDGKVIYAVKKVQRENHTEAFVAHWKEQVENYAAKQGTAVDANTMNFVLGRLARKMATGADMIIRSNTRGWKFSKVDVAKLDKALVAEATNSIKALGLHFGAVDCCTDDTGKAFVIECNSGPGLDGSSFDAWTAALKTLTTPKVAAKVAPVAAAVAAVAAGVGHAVPAAGNAKKDQLKKKMKDLADMVDAADTDEEVAMIEKIWKKMNK